MGHKRIKFGIFLTLLCSVRVLFAQQMIPMKPLPELSTEAKSHGWLPSFSLDSYADFGFDMVSGLNAMNTETFAPGTDLADPTLPLTIAAVADNPIPSNSLNSFRLTQILISDTRKTAVINNRIVKEGDSVGDTVVLSIQPMKVILRGPAGDIEISFLEKPVRGITKRRDDAHHAK